MEAEAEAEPSVTSASVTGDGLVKVLLIEPQQKAQAGMPLAGQGAVCVLCLSVSICEGCRLWKVSCRILTRCQSPGRGGGSGG